MRYALARRKVLKCVPETKSTGNEIRMRIPSMRRSDMVRADDSGARDRRAEWKFFTGDRGQWLWRQIPPAGKAVSSESFFGTLTDCIADARRNGYVLWTSRERRKPS
jgi:hypothetical protein